MPLKRFFFAGSIAMLLIACAQAPAPPQSPAGHQPEEEAAVLRAMDRYMHAISANDLRAQDAMQTPDGMTYRARATGSGEMEVIGQPNSYWVDPARDDGRAVRERYWSPTVLVRGSIAVVWAPYEFWIDGNTSHCGVDVFSFIKRDGHWLVSNSMWTVEPDACDSLRPDDSSLVRPAADSGFAELQERGRAAMGVDQYTSTHRFDQLPDGGRVELQRDVDDPAGIATIRQHLQDVARAFQAGDFRVPGFVHAQEVPGTAVMAAKKDVISYRYTQLPRGAEVRITTSDDEAIAAIHQFMTFQKEDHRAGGHTH